MHSVVVGYDRQGDGGNASLAFAALESRASRTARGGSRHHYRSTSASLLASIPLATG